MNLQSLRYSITELDQESALALVLKVRESRTTRKKPTKKQKAQNTKTLTKTKKTIKNLDADMAGDLLRLLGLE